MKTKVSDPARVANVTLVAPSFGSISVGAAKAHAGAEVAGAATGAGGDVFVAVGLTTTTAFVGVRVGKAVAAAVTVGSGVTVAGSGVVVTGTKTMYGVCVAIRVGWLLAGFELQAEIIPILIASATRKIELLNLTRSP